MTWRWRCAPRPGGPSRAGPSMRAACPSPDGRPECPIRRWRVAWPERVSVDERPPPGNGAEQTFKLRARDALETADLRHSDFDKPRCREASRPVGPNTLFAHTAQICVRPGPWRPARPRHSSGRRGWRWKSAYPGPAKEYGRRSVGCLTIETMKDWAGTNPRAMPGQRREAQSLRTVTRASMMTVSALAPCVCQY